MKRLVFESLASFALRGAFFVDAPTPLSPVVSILLQHP
jgi:hypothetical protein